MRQRNLFKYFSELKYAESFRDGELLFRSLSYFRDHEDNNVRSDKNEGTSVIRPSAGLIVNNLTQEKILTLKDFSFVSSVKQHEIFVFCMSRSFELRIFKEFSAVACVKIVDPPAFCARVEDVLPIRANFPAPQGRARLGHRVEYYDETEAGSPRWAVPDKIATSKLKTYAWQDEFRLIFSTTDAFRFENVTTRLVHDDHLDNPMPAEHHSQLLKVKSLRDITSLHHS